MFQDSDFAPSPENPTLLARLKRNTGHMTWHWQPGEQAFVTEPLSAPLARVIAEDIEGLDGRVARQPQEGGDIRLAMHTDDARLYVQSADRDRAHLTRTPVRDHHLDYLQHTYPSVLWQPHPQGYVASGFTPSQRLELLKPFHREGVRPKDVDLRSASDATMQGLLVTAQQVERLVRSNAQEMQL